VVLGQEVEVDRALLVDKGDDAYVCCQILLRTWEGKDIVGALVDRKLEPLVTNGPVEDLADRGDGANLVLLVLGPVVGHESDIGVEPLAVPPVDVVVMVDTGLRERDVELNLFFLLDNPDPVIGALCDECPDQGRLVHGHDLGLATTLGVKKQLHPDLLIRDPRKGASRLVFFTYDVHSIIFTFEVKTSGAHVEISFADAQLAALCNSKRQLTTHWGGAGFLLVGRHLEELASVDAADVVDLPDTVLEPGVDGVVTIMFDRGRLTITAAPTKGSETTDELNNADGIRIVSLVVGDLT
jgi:hypothetical protein